MCGQKFEINLRWAPQVLVMDPDYLSLDEAGGTGSPHPLHGPR